MFGTVASAQARQGRRLWVCPALPAGAGVHPFSTAQEQSQVPTSQPRRTRSDTNFLQCGVVPHNAVNRHMAVGIAPAPELQAGGPQGEDGGAPSPAWFPFFLPAPLQHRRWVLVGSPLSWLLVTTLQEGEGHTCLWRTYHDMLHVCCLV